MSGSGTTAGNGAKMPPKWAMRLISALNIGLYRLSGGRLMGAINGAPICLVTMTGRRSGRRITVPLMYTPHGKDVLIVASLGGAAKNPVWYYNLVAHPEVVIQHGSTRQTMRVRQAGPEEKARLWPLCVANYPDFADYQKRTTRDIPLMVCEPV